MRLAVLPVLVGAALAFGFPLPNAGAEPFEARLIGPVREFSELELIPWEPRREQLLALAQRHFETVKNWLYVVLGECPRPEALVSLGEADSPHLYFPPADPRKDNRSVRPGFRAGLIRAAELLQARCPDCRIGVSWTLRTLRQQAQNYNRRYLQAFEGFLKEGLSEAEAAARAATLRRTARPSCKAPHTTGAAADLMLLDGSGRVLLEPGDRFWYQSREQFEREFLAESEDGGNARLLEEAMRKADFVRACHEGWHYNHEGSPAHQAWVEAGRPGRCWGPERERRWDTRSFD